ncbi:SAF domain-containing protein [Microbacterium sp. NPDC090225]|uniref:SAF domain-containing protein n=1 Tax=Microbacterium sp. NPDC090225 TaxID=3364207 RepID=UPI00382B0AFB
MSTFSRPRRAFWGDLRFLIGIALVGLSITGVWLIVSSADSATPVLQADRTIVQGETITAADFRVVDVSLGTSTDDYLQPQDLGSGQVAARTIEEGELVPHTASGTAADSRSTTLVVESSIGIPEGVDAGTVVELWQAPLLEDGRAHDAPRILVADAIVAEVIDSEGMLSASRSAVEIVIDRADVADVLAAISGDAALSVVPVGAGS